MSTPYFRRSTLSPSKTAAAAMRLADELNEAEDAQEAFEQKLSSTFTEARAVVQQHYSDSGTLDCMFTLEMNSDKDKILLKTFGDSLMIPTALSYDTATALYQTLSDHLDEMEANGAGMVPDDSRYSND